MLTWFQRPIYTVLGCNSPDAATIETSLPPVSVLDLNRGIYE